MEQRAQGENSEKVVEAQGIEPWSESLSFVRLRNLADVLLHPACAHRPARLGLAAPDISLSSPSSTARFRYSVG